MKITNEQIEAVARSFSHETFGVEDEWERFEHPAYSVIRAMQPFIESEIEKAVDDAVGEIVRDWMD